MAAKPFVINPASSASTQQLVDNITYNMDKISYWFERCAKVPDHALIVSAGPSAKKYVKDNKDTIKYRYDAIFCIKHALPILLAENITPDFCVVLDPRPIDATSTLGYKRRELYDAAPESVRFFVASMTHKSVTDYLISKNRKIVGWHALTPEMSSVPVDYRKKLIKPPYGIPITGGTSSGTRTIELAFYMGITKVSVVGFDSSFDSPKPTDIVDHKGKQRYIKVVVNGKDFWTTGELIAQSQDFERMINNLKHTSDVEVIDAGLETSLVNEIARSKPPNIWPSKHWTEYK